MPELPEIESLRLSLEPLIKGKIIDRVIIRCSKLRFPLPQHFSRKLRGQKIIALTRRGKYLLIALGDKNKTMIMVHLGMSGRLIVQKKQPRKKHDHLIFTLRHKKQQHSENNENSEMVFNDTRRFGFFDLVEKADLDSHPRIAKLGPEPLEPDWRLSDFTQTLKASKSSIKLALLNQNNIAGLGNIYVCEALYRAHIAPMRQASSLKPKEYQKLQHAIIQQLRKAIGAGGATFRDYLNARGTPGQFQNQFKVYQKNGQPCSCGTFIIKITQSGRSSFYCPQCQK